MSDTIPVERLHVRKMCAVALTGVVLTFLSGSIHSHLYSGQKKSVDMEQAAKDLTEIPTECGPWRLKTDQPLSEAALDTLQCAGYVNRTYVNELTGEAVAVTLMLGPPGPMAVHTPEVCYSSRSYEVLEKRERFDIPTGDDVTSTESFWAITLQSNDVDASQLKVYYAWGDGHGWKAARLPRVTYSGRMLLYKIQLATAMASSEKPGSKDAVQSFLVDFLPVANEFLVKPQLDSPTFVSSNGTQSS